jgi:hypothetical protein
MKDNADIPSTVEEVLRGAVTMFEVSPFFKISTTPAFNENGDYVTALKVCNRMLNILCYDVSLNKIFQS